MTTAKLSGDKLHKEAMFDLYNTFLGTCGAFMDTLDEYSSNEAFKSQIRRQLNSAETIIRNEYKRSMGL